MRLLHMEDSLDIETGPGYTAQFFYKSSNQKFMEMP